MMGLLPMKLILLLAAVAQAQDFFPIDSFEMSPDKSFLDSEDYFSRDQTSRHGDDYPSEYDSDEDYDSSTFSSVEYDPQENEALFDSPSRPSSDRKRKRQEYFDGLSKKVHGPSRKDLDLVPVASDHFPRQRSERNKRARLSDYDLYYPKRKVNNENLRSNPTPKSQPENFDFDDFFYTTMNPVFDSERPSSTGFNDQRESRSQNPYDEQRKPSSEYKPDSSYRKSSHSAKPRKLLPGFEDDSYSNTKPFRSIEPRRPSSFDDSHHYSKPSHSVEPRRSPSGFNDDFHSYSKPSHSVEPRRPSPGFNDDFHSYSKPSHSAEPRRPPSGFNDDFHSYNKPSHSVEPKRSASVFDFHDDSFSKTSHSIHDEPRKASLEYNPKDFDAKHFLDEPRKPTSAFTYQTESYPKHPPTESYHKKPARKIRQRSKKIEVAPYRLKPIEPESLSQFFSVPKTKDSQTYRSKSVEPESLSQFFSVPKTKDSSSRSARPMRVRSSPRKLSEVHGRSAAFDDDFPSKPASVSFKKERRRPGLFTEEKEHFLSATGYGKPVREQFHEQGTAGPHSYKFGYNTGDTDNPMARYEERSPDGLVKGSYSYVDPLGKLKVVHYESHPEHGFKTTL